MKALIVILVMALLLLSGCTSTQTQYGSPGPNRQYNQSVLGQLIPTAVMPYPETSPSASSIQEPSRPKPFGLDNDTKAQNAIEAIGDQLNKIANDLDDIESALE